MGVYFNKLMTKHLSPICKQLHVDLLTKPIYEGRGQILMFHRVVPQGVQSLRIHNHLSLEISPQHLEEVAKYYQRQNYDPITLDQISTWLNENANNNRKFVVFTFDDGYKDNLTYAYPILKAHNIPFTIYVATNLPDKKAIFWWYLLERLVNQESSIKAQLGPNTIDLKCSSIKEKENAFYQLRSNILTFDETNQENILKDFFQPFGFGIFDLNDEINLTWKDVLELSNDNLVTIGAHTVSHHNLCSLSDEIARQEILHSKEKIEQHIQKEVKHFSYPLGKYNEKLRMMVENSSFATATTTRTSNIFSDHINRMFELPRVSINSLTTENVLKLHSNGFFHPILNRFKRIV